VTRAARARSGPPSGRRALLLLAILSADFFPACSRSRDDERKPSESSDAPSATARAVVDAESAAPLELLHLPDADESLPPPIGDGLLPFAPPSRTGRCPSDMVDVRGEFCIDRFEISLVDRLTERPLSPHYHPTRAQTVATWERYQHASAGRAGEPAVPVPPEYQLRGDFTPSARSVPGVIPQGYLSALVAEAACAAAGKRLCTLSEWTTACRGEQNRKYPYGSTYADGACNVFRESHPAAVLHGDASREHLDPRLGLVEGSQGPLLRRTGEVSTCRSEWGADAIFDMVGNVDEWVSEGVFVGGFFSRATREGCDARVSSHPPQYFDYSLGARCCR
jgi:hypothetical protein